MITGQTGEVLEPEAALTSPFLVVVNISNRRRRAPSVRWRQCDRLQISNYFTSSQTEKARKPKLDQLDRKRRFLANYAQLMLMVWRAASGAASGELVAPHARR